MNAEPNSPAYQRKPDPSEPWRYVCPECEAQVHGDYHTVRKYQCRQCHTLWHEDDLKDLKGGE